MAFVPCNPERSVTQNIAATIESNKGETLMIFLVPFWVLCFLLDGVLAIILLSEGRSYNAVLLGVLDALALLFAILGHVFYQNLKDQKTGVIYGQLCVLLLVVGSLSTFLFVNSDVGRLWYKDIGNTPSEWEIVPMPSGTFTWISNAYSIWQTREVDLIVRGETADGKRVGARVRTKVIAEEGPLLEQHIARLLSKQSADSAEGSVDWTVDLELRAAFELGLQRVIAQYRSDALPTPFELSQHLLVNAAVSQGAIEHPAFPFLRYAEPLEVSSLYPLP